jgi:hypothetical protein
MNAIVGKSINSTAWERELHREVVDGMTTRATRSLTRRVAYHEAGHAVVTIVRAGLIPELAISRDGMGGYSQPPPVISLTRYSVEVALAGLLAEARAIKVSAMDCMLFGGQDDFRAATRAALWAAAEEGGTDHLSIMFDALRVARHVISQYWSAVEKLAWCLSGCFNMSPKEVARVAAIDPDDAWRYSRWLDVELKHIRRAGSIRVDFANRTVVHLGYNARRVTRQIMAHYESASIGRRHRSTASDVRRKHT